MKESQDKPDVSNLSQEHEELLSLIRELAFQNGEKAKRAEELLIANIELVFQNEEKAKRAEELLIANKELVFQNEEKAKRAEELSAAIAKTLKLTSQLEVHQVELELQNEDLKLAEAALRQIEARHTAMISNISDVIGIIGVDGFMKYKSPNIEKWFGWKPHDLVGTDGWLTVHPDDLARIQKEFYTLLEKENSVTTVEYKYKCKDGSYKPIKLTAMNLVNDPAIGGVLLNYHDISRRRQIEEELELESTRLSLATRAGGVGVWDYDVVNNKLLWDDRMFALYGTNKKDFSGDYHTWQNSLHPDDIERCNQEFHMALSGQKEYNTEFRVIRPDGAIHNIRAIATICRDDSGEALRMIGTNWDITELRKSEKEKLDDSESRYRSIFQGSPDGIMIIDEQTKMIVFANAAQCEILGYTEQQLQTMTIAEIHPKDTFQDTLAKFDKIAIGEKTFFENILCLKKNGENFYADIASSFIFINNRKCIVCFFRNVTLRRQADETLRKSEELLWTVVSNSSDLTTLTDANGLLTFISPQCEAVLGFPGDEFLGLRIPDIIHPDDVEMIRLAWECLFHEGKEIRELEYRIIDKKGAVRWLSHSAKLFKVNEVSIGALSTIRHITDLKMAEQSIKESEEKYRTMLNASPDCMVLTNLSGIIIEVSTIGIHLLGAYSRDELVGKDICQFVSPEESDLLRELLVRTTNEGVVQNMGITVRKHNQSLFAGEISATLMQSPDRAPISFLITIHDISQRKKKQEKQIHADRMSTLGEMAAGIAHEINQPLNIISMVMDKIIFETAKTEIIDIGFLKSKSDKIFENITRIRDIIDHVRAFSRSQDEFVLTTFSVNSSIVNAASMIMEQFKHQGINLNLQLEQQIPPIIGNTYKFEQVILNLLVNAKDAVSEKRNKLDENYEMLIGIRSYQVNQAILVEITDNGVGISKDEIHKIMLPFYTTKEEGKGTGLGLSISYQIIKELNGTIEITSESMNGTKIKLFVPIQKNK